MATRSQRVKAVDGTRSGSCAPSPVLPSPLSLTEAHHRIANSLQIIASLVRLQASDLAKRRRDSSMSVEDVLHVLEDVAGRIGTVALLHRLLSKAPQQEVIDLRAYLGDVCDSLAAALSFGGRVEISAPDIGPCHVPADQAVPLAVLVSELVTNAIKYGHPSGVAGRIAVSCRRFKDGSLMLEISDDGVGLPEDFNPAADGGLGFRVVRSLAQQLGGTLAFDSTALGLTVRLELSSMLLQ